MMSQLNINRLRWIFWGMTFIVVFALLQREYAYFFYYIEQLQLFTFSWNSLEESVSELGGFSFWISSFLYQFFILPFAGAGLTAVLIVGSCCLLQRILERLMPLNGSYFLSTIPALFLLPACVDMDFSAQGMIGYLMVLILLLGYVSLSRSIFRFFYGLLSVPLLFWLAGPVALILAVSVYFWSLIQGGKDVSWGWLVLVEYAALAFLFPLYGFMESWESALVPDFYYFAPETNKWLYFFWGSFPILLLVAWVVGQVRWRVDPRLKIGMLFFQGVLACVLVIYMLRPQNPVLLYNMRQDYALRQQDWESIISSFSDSVCNEQTLNILNLALAKTGRWEDLFNYPQYIHSLIGVWDEQLPDAIAMNELFYHIGDVGMSQKLAYEGYVISKRGNPRLLQRLVETNLIFGEYQVAEKYLKILEQTLFYKSWAEDHRQFLYKDKEVEADRVYGCKRKALGLETNPAVSMDFGIVLERLAVNDPSNMIPLRYLVAYYLLYVDFPSFMRLYDAYYGSEIWPSLTELQQEALIAWMEDETELWGAKGIESKISQRFMAFKELAMRQSSYTNVEKELSNSFGRTYWYYLMKIRKG